jgi:hypothetical protein
MQAVSRKTDSRKIRAESSICVGQPTTDLPSKPSLNPIGHHIALIHHGDEKDAIDGHQPMWFPPIARARHGVRPNMNSLASTKQLESEGDHVLSGADARRVAADPSGLNPQLARARQNGLLGVSSPSWTLAVFSGDAGFRAGARTGVRRHLSGAAR